MSQVELTIVVCTRNRAEYLSQALESYSKVVTSVPWEMTIVNNGSTDGTADIIARFIAAGRVRAQTVFEPRPGLSRARNTGWRAANGEIVAFTDDDCYPNADLVDQIDLCMRQGALDYLGGRVLLHDPQDAPVTIQLRETPLDLPPGTFLSAGLIHGANMIVRRSVLEKLQGFDELLGAGTPIASGEDIEFLSRAAAAGFAGAYDPRPIVHHHHRRRTQEQVKKLNQAYDFGRGAYYMACLLDTRRRQLLKLWYWRVRRTLMGKQRLPDSIMAALRELRGAMAYYLARKRLPDATAAPVEPSAIVTERDTVS